MAMPSSNTGTIDRLAVPSILVLNRSISTCICIRHGSSFHVYMSLPFLHACRIPVIFSIATGVEWKDKKAHDNEWWNEG